LPNDAAGDRRLATSQIAVCASQALQDPATVAACLMGRGVREKPARQLASSGKDWWRLASTEQAKRAMPNTWFEELGLVGLEQRHIALNRVGNRHDT
jgi:hypothetical protein